MVGSQSTLQRPTLRINLNEHPILICSVIGVNYLSDLFLSILVIKFIFSGRYFISVNISLSLNTSCQLEQTNLMQTYIHMLSITFRYSRLLCELVGGFEARRYLLTLSRTESNNRNESGDCSGASTILQRRRPRVGKGEQC
jgi:hypothetical protein